MVRYFEDYEVGRVYEPDGRYEVTTSEVKEFAEKYDPQPFHLDEEAAKESIFGSLAASGWHTASMCMRVFADGFLDEESSMGARGIDELRWRKPVYPGDTLRVEVEILDKRTSESRPEMGHIRTKLRGYNQDDDCVVEWIALGMHRRRDTNDS
ncbi:MAG: MaoC family dehydratase [Natronomonas sp.]|jgi:acyl dehydratase|uniref:MaoC family dehydratase n=1 Tax=Natronomonas salsuginis TaxID=2217661 RepID=A0A4U5JCD7_9EURY|nr:MULTISPECIES: MaoC family dehydratase [Natronomonas]MDR9382585.1 MaoC family dehydratase [Natronomonas sp.]MDR9431776.1 MaoC family dehydratase [Natronomonas sp.]TKR26285.1 MaoC family dehydratase [Natronomonas salsuginis]